ncbi:hypothetical protein [Nostoc sp. UHCC 0870]|uniref:hypothetical protein n=1 Tax=Nostoc sp. UHCC 0870 TaxID=2914041 RepID=UPI001EE10986|nr:hypothetical protein [Nostoc sp. UHCC 0870]UKP01609.1 hypothetical protein L6494_30755 [Nostoc sp. UHCC 0870]
MNKERSKIRLKDSVWEWLDKESERLEKSPLDTLYFVIDMYRAFLADSVKSASLPNLPQSTQPQIQPEQKPPAQTEDYEIDLDI